jgi:hypothetical protein
MTDETTTPPGSKLAFYLTGAALVALAGSIATWQFSIAFAAEAEALGAEVPALTIVFFKWSGVAVFVPVVLWVVAMIVTSRGRKRRGAGIACLALLLLFGVLWPWVGHVAFNAPFRGY